MAAFSVDEMRTLVSQLVNRVGLDVTLNRSGRTFRTRCIFRDRMPWLLSYHDQIAQGDIISLGSSGETFRVSEIDCYPGPGPMTAKEITATALARE